VSEGKILLGFGIPSGEPVYLSLHHLAIFGMTQLSGKTTTLEALISRSGLKAIAFKTKRGEAGFTKYNLVTPYYKPRADWQFVEGLVNVALGEKVKYEPGMRWAIMKVCRGHHDLRQIQKAAQDLAKESKREFMKSVFEKLAAYLEIVVPELEKWVFSDKLELKEGVNVMDLSGMRLETQHLVIASTIEYAFSYLDHVVVIVPEAWETLPQGKMTPVKWVAQQFIRKGAAIGNYLWLDSQDIGGIDKTPLRQCDNWLMGRMKEAHEVERILKQLLGLKVPKEEIQTLSLGHFYAAIGNEVKKVYVLPVGVPEHVGEAVAHGTMTPEQVRDAYLKSSRVLEDEDLVYKELYEKVKQDRDKMAKEMEKLQEQFVDIRKKIYQELKDEFDKKVDKLQEDLDQAKEENEAFHNLRELLRQILDIPAGAPTTTTPGASEVSVDVETTVTEFNVSVKRETVKATNKDATGQILLLASKDWLNERRRISDIRGELYRVFNSSPRPGTVETALADLSGKGILEREREGKSWFYWLRPEAKDLIKVTEVEN